MVLQVRWLIAEGKSPARLAVDLSTCAGVACGLGYLSRFTTGVQLSFLIVLIDDSVAETNKLPCF